MYLLLLTQNTQQTKTFHNAQNLDISKVKSCNVPYFHEVFFVYLSLSKPITWYSLMNMRQLHILFNWAKTWHRIVCWFLRFYRFLPVFAQCGHKIVLFRYTDHIMQKKREINKQSDVKFWLDWRKYGTVSFSFTCTAV